MSSTSPRPRLPSVISSMKTSSTSNRDASSLPVASASVISAGTGSDNAPDEDIYNVPIDPRTGDKLVPDRQDKTLHDRDRDSSEVPVTHPSKCVSVDKIIVAVLALLSVILAVLLGVVGTLVANGSASAAHMLTMQIQLDAMQRTCSQIQLSMSSQSANLSSSVAAHTTASAELNQLAMQAENNTLNNILGQVVGTGSSLQLSILQTQSSLQQVNLSIASIVSSFAGSSVGFDKKYASACKASFVPDVNVASTGIGQSCIWHSGATIFSLDVNGTVSSGLVNRPNLTVTFSCSFAQLYGQGSINPAVSFTSSDANWFSSSANTACDGSQHTFFQQYPGMFTLPTKATATFAWTWCGNGDPPMTINSMCARIDWV